MKDKPYLVVSAGSVGELEDYVKEWIEKGYRPTGGVQILYRTWENERKGYQESDTEFYQALVYSLEC